MSYVTTRLIPAAVKAALHDADIPRWAESVTMLHEDDGTGRFRAHKCEIHHARNAIQAARNRLTLARLNNTP